MVIITWWDAKAMVPSQPTMIIDSENDAVSMPISKAMGVPSETRRRTNCLDQPKTKKRFTIWPHLLSRKENEKEQCHHNNAREECCHAGSHHSHLRHASLAVNQHIVADDIEQIAR